MTIFVCHLLRLLLTLQLGFLCTGFPFFAVVPSIVGVLAYTVSDHLECVLRECCRDASAFNSTRFYHELKTKLYGQHIAEDRLFNHIKAHLEGPAPSKPLVLSLHGFTGIGKNYASSIIASNILRKGEQSRFYNFYDSTIHFPFKHSVAEYRVSLQADIKRSVSSCGLSIFVFDEVHKMPTGLLDSITPYLGFSESIDGVDYRRAIFIFLGNSGGSVINSYVFDALSRGQLRTSIQYGDVRRDLTRAIYNEKGAFELSDLISKHLISSVIPFLPLQEIHIRQCVVDMAKRMGVEASDEMQEFIIEELDWGPSDARYFSESGCKLVYEKIGFFLQRSMLPAN